MEVPSGCKLEEKETTNADPLKWPLRQKSSPRKMWWWDATMGMDMIRPFNSTSVRSLLIFRAGTCKYRFDGHQHVGPIWETLKAAIFNLGYLPSADKSVITLPATTISDGKICARLEKGWANGYYDLLWSWRRRHRVWCCAGLVSQLPKDYTAIIYRTLNHESATVFGHDVKIRSYRHG